MRGRTMDDRYEREASLASYQPEWEPYVRAWRNRLVDEQCNRVTAANVAREAAQRAAAVLVEQFGCARCYLFGSLTGRSSSPFGAHSDVDLAVEGLPMEHYSAALATLENVFPLGTGFDVVRLEDARPSLAAQVQSTGEVLADGAAIRGARRRPGQ